MTRTKPSGTQWDAGTADLTSHVPLSTTLQETPSESRDVTPGRDGTGRMGRPPYRGGLRVPRPTVPKIPIEDLFPPSKRTAMSRMKDPPIPEQAQAQPITSPSPAQQSPNFSSRRYMGRARSLVSAVRTAQCFLRWACESTEHFQRGQTSLRLADQCRRWALQVGANAFVTAYAMTLALEREGVRDYCDGSRHDYAIRIQREIDLPSRRKSGAL